MPFAGNESAGVAVAKPVVAGAAFAGVVCAGVVCAGSVNVGSAGGNCATRSLVPIDDKPNFSGPELLELPATALDLSVTELLGKGRAAPDGAADNALGAVSKLGGVSGAGTG